MGPSLHLLSRLGQGDCGKAPPLVPRAWLPPASPCSPALPLPPASPSPRPQLGRTRGAGVAYTPMLLWVKAQSLAERWWEALCSPGSSLRSPALPPPMLLRAGGVSAAYPHAALGTPTSSFSWSCSLNSRPGIQMPSACAPRAPTPGASVPTQPKEHSSLPPARPPVCLCPRSSRWEGVIYLWFGAGSWGCPATSLPDPVTATAPEGSGWAGGSSPPTSGAGLS